MNNQDITFAEATLIVINFSDCFDDEQANEARAGKAFETLQVYVERSYGNPDNEPVEQGIRDLISDLLHLAHQLGIDTDTIIERSRRCFEDELENPIG